MSRPASPARSPWGSFDRKHALRRLARDHFDVLVIGGGITGAGVALDAAARGLRTALVEQRDFASGTSSRSSKLVHGGLRYLQNGEVRLVYEALAERQVLLRNAPHLVEVLPFLVPLLATDGVLDRRLARAFGAALWAYDLTGGLRIGHRHRRVSTSEALAHVTSLRADRLGGAYVYYDAQVDDARLTLAVARTAALGFGATLANRCRVVGLTADEVNRHHVRVVAEENGSTGATSSTSTVTFEISASAVVNASGAWADQVRSLDPADEHPDPPLRPAKGVHLTIAQSAVGNDIGVVLPVPGEKRTIFVVPWGDVTYAGTTDTDYDGPLDEPACTAGDVDYVLSALRGALHGSFERRDVLSTWAGLRPLVDDQAARTGSSTGLRPGRRIRRNTADLSRRHHVAVSPSGIVTITGGKLTTYRRMAADTVDAVLDVLTRQPELRLPPGIRRNCPTHDLALAGADGSAAARRSDVHLGGRYGGELPVIEAMIERDPALGLPLVEGLPYLRAEAIFAARYEMAVTLDDVVVRRTRAHLLDRRACIAAAPAIADLLAPELGWDGAERDRQVASYHSLARAEEAAATGGAKRDSGLSTSW